MAPGYARACPEFVGVALEPAVEGFEGLDGGGDGFRGAVGFEEGFEGEPHLGGVGAVGEVVGVAEAVA